MNSKRHKDYTDEELAAIWVDGPPPQTGHVHVADYDEQWPALYRREAARIRELLADKVLLLEHVGSTSVPGLAAKPIIDIDLVVADPADEPAYLPPLQAAGYRLVIREPGWDEHRALKGPDTNVNLHVWRPGSVEVRRHLAFRDWLRANETDRTLYADTKRHLATREWKYLQNYADAKSDVVTEILARALANRP
ncbi:GrpB family protein [Solihabitans fulvus]|uniref:GrpB family protein n=1 Tax=Solihabitans fulvus TaxID=1892852 RepID=A0A5B2XPG4_9PSEU|nr:GrpB family protein [Solihabitans fulvus]